MSSIPRLHLPDGHPSLAGVMASDRDRTIMVFKRFDRLTARNLLYLQSELAELQKRLEEYDERDRGSPQARNWESFGEKRGNEPGRMEVVRKIGNTMLEYSKYMHAYIYVCVCEHLLMMIVATSDIDLIQRDPARP